MGDYTRSQWEMFVKAARWLERNESLKELPGPLFVWLRNAVSVQIQPEDNGEIPL